MARNRPRPPAPSEIRLEPLEDCCRSCGHKSWVAHHSPRTVATLEGLVRLRLVVRRCVNPACPLYHEPCRPEEEGAFALRQGEFGLDVIAVVGAVRHVEHRSVPYIHRELSGRGVNVSERTVTNLLDRYEELVDIRLTDRAVLREKLKDPCSAITGAHVPQRLGGEAGRNRALVEYVAPGKYLTGKAESPDAIRRAVPVGDEKHASYPRRRVRVTTRSVRRDAAPPTPIYPDEVRAASRRRC